MMRFRIVLFLSLAPLLPAAAEEGEAPSAPVAKLEGTASWYGGKFQGRTTASGEVFDTRAFTAAHRSLPFGTMVRVTNLDNGRSAVVRITDRGPFVDDRLIDISQAAAIELDMMKTGVARVSVEVLSRPADKPGSFYRIQVAAFRDRENARRLKALLAEKGFVVYCETVAEGYTRVHVDNVAAAELESVRDVLRGLGFRSPLVKSIGKQ